MTFFVEGIGEMVSFVSSLIVLLWMTVISPLLTFTVDDCAITWLLIAMIETAKTPSDAKANFCNRLNARIKLSTTKNLQSRHN